jgi:UDP-2-acetamido-2-deoxy-ribo-hexuluronate aminotransferase
VANREEIQANFKEAAIETGIHYPVPLHKQPALQDMFSGLNLPVTEKLAKEIISLPLHPYLTDDEVSQIIELFLKIAKVVK